VLPAGNAPFHRTQAERSSTPCVTTLGEMLLRIGKSGPRSKEPTSAGATRSRGQNSHSEGVAMKNAAIVATNSIAMLHRRLVVAIARTLPRHPCCAGSFTRTTRRALWHSKTNDAALPIRSSPSPRAESNCPSDRSPTPGISATRPAAGCRPGWCRSG